MLIERLVILLPGTSRNGSAETPSIEFVETLLAQMFHVSIHQV